MSGRDKLIVKILNGTNDSGIMFGDVCNLLESFGFSMRITGSHHIFYREGIDEIINIQPKNGKAKPYQIRQIRNLIVKYGLEVNPDV